MTRKKESIQADDTPSNKRPNQSNVPGGSVDKHALVESENISISKGEIKQQNENL